MAGQPHCAAGPGSQVGLAAVEARTACMPTVEFRLHAVGAAVTVHILCLAAGTGSWKAGREAGSRRMRGLCWSPACLSDAAQQLLIAWFSRGDKPRQKGSEEY